MNPVRNEFQIAAENLKHALKSRKITYRELARGIGMSESGVKKLFSGRDGSFQRLAQICQYAGLSLREIVGSTHSIDVAFSNQQQEEFLKTPILFQLYWLLAYERIPLEEAKKILGLTSKNCFHYLRKLDSLDMIRLLPGDRLRLPSIKAVRWTGDGVFMRKIYQDWSRQMVEQLAVPNTSENELFLLRYLKVTPKTLAELMQAQRALEQEFIRRGIQEMRTQREDLQHMRWLAAIDNRSFLSSNLRSPVRS